MTTFISSTLAIPLPTSFSPRNRQIKYLSRSRRRPRHAKYAVTNPTSRYTPSSPPVTAANTPANASISKLARQIAQETANIYTTSSNEPTIIAPPTSPNAKARLQTPCDHVSASCIVQDLPIPSAPHYWQVRPEHFIAQCRVFLSSRTALQKDVKTSVEELHNLLGSLRAWTSSIADVAHGVLESKSSEQEYGECIDALLILLQLAGFSIMPELPQVSEPPSADALTLGNSIEKTLDPTLLRYSSVARKHLEKRRVPKGDPSYYPYLFIATRGVNAVRKEGMLFGQKIRAIERSYFGWIRTPFTLLIQSSWDSLRDAFRGLFLGEEKQRLRDGEEEDDSEHKANERFVRRIVPAVELKSWESIGSLLLPTLTQEPAHEMMVLMYQEIVLDKETIGRERRQAIMGQLAESLAQAINPIPPGRQKAQRSEKQEDTSVVDSFARPLGEALPVSLAMFQNVAWGTTNHFFPSTFVLPATRDLLRIDALTFIALVSTLITYVRNMDSVFVYASLVVSLLSYSLRVVFGLRNALVSYNASIAKEKTKSIVGQGRFCVQSLALVAAEEAFVNASCVWLSQRVVTDLSAMEVQKALLGEANMSEGCIAKWREWLGANGF